MDSEQLINTINSINDVKVSGRPKAKKVAARRTNSKRRRKSVNAASSSASYVKIIVFVFVCVLLVAVIGSIIGYAVWNNSFTDLKLSDYTGVTLSGYDGNGSAELDIIGDKTYADFFRTVEASLSSTENLSNGDQITVTYSYDEEVAKENKLRIDGSEAHISVEGLTPPNIIDKDLVFSGLNVTFEGISPCIDAIIENTSADEFVSQVEYSLAADKNHFESGEIVNIKATLPEEYLDNPAYTIALTDSDYEVSYTAPETDTYFVSADQVTEEILSQLENAGYDLISKADAKEYGLRIFQQEAHIKPVFVGNTTTFQWNSPYVISAYFHNVTEEGKSKLESHANDVQIVYGVTLTQADGTSCQAEMVIQFVDLVQKRDGTYDLNLESGRIVSASYRNSNIKKLVTNDSDGTYETTKLTE